MKILLICYEHAQYTDSALEGIGLASKKWTQTQAADVSLMVGCCSKATGER